MRTILCSQLENTLGDRRLTALSNNDVGCALRTTPQFNETHGAAALDIHVSRGTCASMHIAGRTLQRKRQDILRQLLITYARVTVGLVLHLQTAGTCIVRTMSYIAEV